MTFLERYGDEALAELLNDVLNEQERRQRRAQVPGQIAAMAAQYVNDGGDPEDIQKAIAPAPVE